MEARTIESEDQIRYQLMVNGYLVSDYQEQQLGAHGEQAESDKKITHFTAGAEVTPGFGSFGTRSATYYDTTRSRSTTRTSFTAASSQYVIKNGRRAKMLTCRPELSVI